MSAGLPLLETSVWSVFRNATLAASCYRPPMKTRGRRGNRARGIRGIGGNQDGHPPPLRGTPFKRGTLVLPLHFESSKKSQEMSGSSGVSSGNPPGPLWKRGRNAGLSRRSVFAKADGFKCIARQKTLELRQASGNSRPRLPVMTPTNSPLFQRGVGGISSGKSRYRLLFGRFHLGESQAEGNCDVTSLPAHEARGQNRWMTARNSAAG